MQKYFSINSFCEIKINYKIIPGVTCVVVKDTVTVDGEVDVETGERAELIDISVE
jgi:hypothetical protein